MVESELLSTIGVTVGILALASLICLAVFLRRCIRVGYEMACYECGRLICRSLHTHPTPHTHCECCCPLPPPSNNTKHNSSSAHLTGVVTVNSFDCQRCGRSTLSDGEGS